MSKIKAHISRIAELKPGISLLDNQNQIYAIFKSSYTWSTRAGNTMAGK